MTRLARVARRAVPLQVLLLCLAQPAAAHVPQLHGRLVDLVDQSDLIVVGTVQNVRTADASSDTTVRVDAQLVGGAPEAMLTFRGGPRLAAGRRAIFFLRQGDAHFECVQPAGAVLASRPEDDAAYRRTIRAVRAALRGADTDRAPALRAALFAALSAAAPPLRFYAVLDFAALAHHGLTESERQGLERLVADPAADPALRPILTSLLRGTDDARAAAGFPPRSED